MNVFLSDFKFALALKTGRYINDNNCKVLTPEITTKVSLWLGHLNNFNLCPSINTTFILRHIDLVLLVTPASSPGIALLQF